MYKEFYKFKKNPFQLAPDSDFLFASDKHVKALTYIKYGLYEKLGFILLTGEIGSGKTIAIHSLAKDLGEEFHAALVLNTSVDADELLPMIAREYGIETNGKGKAGVIDSLNRFLIRRHEEEKCVLLIVDEAQNLSLQSLEAIRMLSNFQSGTQQLLQIMLVGQPELLTMLQKQELKQFSQRIAVHYHLTALDKEETSLYIRHRLKIAGGEPKLFTSAAEDKIYEFSGGIPRLINLLCQAALVYGFADEEKKISQDIIQEIKNDNMTIGINSSSDPSDSKLTGNRDMQNDLNLENRVGVLEEELAGLKKKITGYIKNVDSEISESFSRQMAKLKQELAQEKNRYARLVQEYRLLKQKYEKVVKKR